MQEWQLIRDAIAERLEEVEGIGHVALWAPDITSFKSLKGLLSATGSRNAQDQAIDRVNLWFLERSGFDSRRGGMGAGVPIGHYQHAETFTISGFYSYTGEASYNAFQDILENLREKFIQEISLGHPERDWLSGPTEGHVDMADFFGIPCHTCTMDVEVNYSRNAGYR